MKTRIKELRAKLDLTQEELSKKASISVKQLQRIEREISNPNMITLERIAKGLNTTLIYLLNDEK